MLIPRVVPGTINLLNYGLGMYDIGFAGVIKTPKMVLGDCPFGELRAEFRDLDARF